MELKRKDTDYIYLEKIDNNLLDTQLFQEYINKSSSQGKSLFVKSGTYKLSTIFLKDNTHIVFEKDVRIIGADSVFDYEPDEKVNYPLYQDGSHSYFNCSMFVGINVKNISITGGVTIDMNSVWDDNNIRNNTHRGAKCIALKNCKNITLGDFTILNATDLAIYFAGCENVDIYDIKLRVYIDGISPDNSKKVKIRNCVIESGDDAIVLKSSYTLNKSDVCEDVEIKDCIVKSRCNCIKFGTETNGGFSNIRVKDCYLKECRLSGIAVESVDGAIINNIKFENINMNNVAVPIFVYLGKRLRGPADSKIGSISNISFKNITAQGPYNPYNIIEWNYDSFIHSDIVQYPWIIYFGYKYTKSEVEALREKPWQITSNVCGLKDHCLKNISLKNVKFVLRGGVEKYDSNIKEEVEDYPEAYVYGKILPAKGIYFRYVEGLKLENVVIKTELEDKRTDFVFDKCENVEVYNG